MWAVFGPLVAWSFVGTGLYASRRRPESRFGALMILLGFAWLLAPLGAAEDPWLFTLGIVFGSLWGPVLAHVLLSFPSGRLAGRERAVVIAGYVLVPLAPIPGMLFSESDVLAECAGPCPENPLLISSNEGLGEALFAAGSAVVMTLCLLVVWLLIARWRAAGQSERRSLAPLFGAGAVTLLLVVAYVATKSQVFMTLAFLAFAATPFAFLAAWPARTSRRPAACAGSWRGSPTCRRRRSARGAGHHPRRPGVEPRLLGPRAGPLRRLRAACRCRRATIARSRRWSVTGGGSRRSSTTGRPTTETVRAAGAATALLLENQRLDAELHARMVELRASRARLVQAGDDERRRLERNLHDGAQSRLVAVALNLRLGRGRLEDGSEAAVLIDASIDELKESLDELRELARGIHPAVLSERGLEPAVRSLAARAPVPVDLEGSPGGRLPAAVETAAYFVVSEALTNVAKYARAEHAAVRMERVNGCLALEISDDGVGGAVATAGSGLHGLADRVAALDGELEVTSPPGGGTRLHVQLPIT